MSVYYWIVNIINNLLLSFSLVARSASLSLSQAIYFLMIYFAHAHTRIMRARARALIDQFTLLKLAKMATMSFITNNLVYETPHFSIIYGLRRHMPQVNKEKEEGSVDNHNN